MTTLVVRFDEELSVAHKVTGTLPCPQGVVTTINQHGVSGTRRIIRACSLSWGHDDKCLWIPQHAKAGTTVCGLSLDALPFVPSPEGMRACSGCFDGDEINYIEEALAI